MVAKAGVMDGEVAEEEASDAAEVEGRFGAESSRGAVEVEGWPSGMEQSATQREGDLQGGKVACHGRKG